MNLKLSFCHRVELFVDKKVEIDCMELQAKREKVSSPGL